jgi:hypothetical protein
MNMTEYTNHMKLIDDLSLFVITTEDYYKVVKNQKNIQNLSSLDFTVITEDEFKAMQTLPKGTKHLVVTLNKAS